MELKRAPRLRTLLTLYAGVKKLVFVTCIIMIMCKQLTCCAQL